MSQDISARLRRLEVQVRAFRELHVRELGDVADRLAAIAKLHADELQLILDELADILNASEAVGGGPSEDEAVAPDGTASASVDATPSAASLVTDPAAASPKRAKWLAEQERRAHVSRRELLRGREDR